MTPPPNEYHSNDQIDDALEKTGEFYERFEFFQAIDPAGVEHRNAEHPDHHDGGHVGSDPARPPFLENEGGQEALHIHKTHAEDKKSTFEKEDPVIPPIAGGLG